MFIWIPSRHALVRIDEGEFEAGEVEALEEAGAILSEADLAAAQAEVDAEEAEENR